MDETSLRPHHSLRSLPAEYEPTRPRWPAMIGSLFAHAVVIAGFLWLLTAAQQQGTTEQPTTRSVGMALAHRTPDHTRYVTEPDQNVRAAADLRAETASAAVSASLAGGAVSSQTDPNSTPRAASPLGLKPPIDLSAVLAEMNSSRIAQSGTGTGTGSASGSADGFVEGQIRLSDGRSPDQLGDHELVPGGSRVGQGAGQATTEVFGVSGSGSTFVYVFDRSESMSAAGSAPLRAAKTELIRSLDTLTERQQFQIIFYNDTPDVFHSEGDATGLVTGSPATIARARDYVRRTVAVGGTEHEVALRMALRLAPDVIFFLTDAKILTMSAAQLDDITRRAEDAGTTIHAIQFGTGPPPTGMFLEKLVRRGGGGYRYVDVTGLK